MRQSVFILSGIQYCRYMKWMSFFCLANIYCSKLTPILYDYNIIKLAIVYQIWLLNGLGTRRVIQGSWVRIPLWASIFHFVILGFRSLQPEVAHANEINHDIHIANILF